MAANFAIRALEENDREEMTIVISKYANKYEHFVNATTFITGKWVQRIPDFYSDKSIEYIRSDVEFCILIVYLKTAFDNGLESTIKKAIKKQFGVDELLLEGFSWIN